MCRIGRGMVGKCGVGCLCRVGRGMVGRGGVGYGGQGGVRWG